MADWLKTVDIDGWTLLFAALTLVGTWIAAIATELAARELRAVVTSDIPPASVTPSDEI